MVPRQTRMELRTPGKSAPPAPLFSFLRRDGLPGILPPPGFLQASFQPPGRGLSHLGLLVVLVLNPVDLLQQVTDPVHLQGKESTSCSFWEHNSCLAIKIATFRILISFHRIQGWQLEQHGFQIGKQDLKQNSGEGIMVLERSLLWARGPSRNAQGAGEMAA